MTCCILHRSGHLQAIRDSRQHEILFLAVPSGSDSCSNEQKLLTKATNANREDEKIPLLIFLGEYMPIAFVRLPATLQQLAIGKTTLYARIAKGTFPPPVKFSERVSAWPQHEVDAVLRALLRSASEDDLRALVAHLIRLRSQPNDAGTIAA